MLAAANGSFPAGISGVVILEASDGDRFGRMWREIVSAVLLGLSSKLYLV